MLRWRASGMNSWKGRVLSSGGLRGWGFMSGGVYQGIKDLIGGYVVFIVQVVVFGEFCVYVVSFYCAFAMVL